MSYYFATDVDASFDDAITRVTAALKAGGFGVLTTIDVQATLKDKLGVDVPPHVILGACNPPLAHRALQAEEWIGLMLPCNVAVRETEAGVQVAGIDPAAAMGAVDNPALAEIAGDVRDRLRGVIEGL